MCSCCDVREPGLQRACSAHQEDSQPKKCTSCMNKMTVHDCISWSEENDGAGWATPNTREEASLNLEPSRAGRIEDYSTTTTVSLAREYREDDC